MGPKFPLLEKTYFSKVLKPYTGGEIGIRTLGTVTGTPHFECGAFDHSAISPQIQEAGHYRKNGAPLRQSGAIN